MSSRIWLPTGFLVLALWGVIARSVAAGPPAPLSPAAHPPAAPGTFPPSWIAGVNCSTDPKIQMHAYNDDLWILRQSKCTHFESPFVFVIFGLEKVLVIDTGAPGDPGFGEAVSGLVESWSEKNGVTDLELIVAHSHPHSDHIYGDPEFAGLVNTTVVGHSLSQVQSFFGFDPGQWPEQQVTYDLGGRTLDVLATPGHHPASLTFYDSRTQLLLTGDIVYPGHLFIFAQSQWDDFKDSIERLLHFAGTNPVEWVLGCHIEWTSQPGGCLSWGTSAHPDERVLQMRPQVLKEIHDTAASMGNNPVCGNVQDDFVIHPVYVCGITGGC